MSVVIMLFLRIACVISVIFPSIQVWASASHIAPGWRLDGPQLAESYVELTFALRQQNLDQLDKLFHDISDPIHPSYGRHLSFDDVNALTAPSAVDSAAVEAALKELGAAASARRTASGDFVVAEVNVAQAERFFGGRFLRFSHADGRQALRNPGGELPHVLRHAVDFVMPLDQPVGMASASGRRAGPQHMNTSVSNAAFQVTPAVLRELYEVGDAEASGAGGGKQAVTGFLQQWYTDKSLQAFFTAHYPKATGRKVSKIVGDGEFMFAGVEAELDVQYIMAMGGNVETEFWSFAGSAPDNPVNEPFLKFLYTLGNTSDAPWIISTSYGEPEDSVTESYAKRCNAEFQKAGVRGISLLFSSGDDGVGEEGHCCENCSAGEGCFVSMWPAASPYVTTVGGTTFQSSVHDAESAADLSGGGFSYRWGMPEWQRNAVEEFLRSRGDCGDTDRFSQSGRGFPDIAAMAVNFVIDYNGGEQTVLGTSAAAPTAAGIFALANDARIAAGRGPLGFLNPLLYQNAHVFNDITDGCNPGCGTKGFCAQKGWDAVTGLGTPSYPKILQLALNVAPTPTPTPPSPRPTPSPTPLPAPLPVPQPAPSPTPTPPTPGSQHYGAPPCGSDELELQLDNARVCAAACMADSDCPKDVPGGKAGLWGPTCEKVSGSQHCVLQCIGDSDCDEDDGAACWQVDGSIGICGYANLALAMFA